MGYEPHTPITTRGRLPKPLNGCIYTTTRNVADERALPALGGTMATELGASSPYAANIVVAVNEGPAKGNKTLQIVHVSIPSEVDQLLSSWESFKADIGGRKFDAGTTTVIKLASAASITSTAGAGPFTDYTADDSQIVDSGTQLEPVYRVVRTNWVKTLPMVSKRYDEATGGSLTTTQTLVKGTIGVDQVCGLSGNLITEYEQLTASWYLKTEHQVVSTALYAGRTYRTSDDYLWPDVLIQTAPGVLPIRIDAWPLREGGVDPHVMPIYLRESYRGPCKADVYEIWGPTAQTPSTPTILRALPIVVSTPFCSISVPPSLHGAISFDASSGTDHPVYKYALATFSYDATNETDWPDTVIKSDEVRPFRGGWLRTRVTVYAPKPVVPPP